VDIENYNNSRGNFSPLVAHNGAVYGFWLIGRWYNATRGKAYYYGAYPPSYLKRLELLFPEESKGTVLHLFSGTLRGNGKNLFSLDINPEPTPGVRPDFITDAEELDRRVPENFFDLVIADPPYGENHLKYGVSKKVNRKKVVHLCSRVLKDGGFLIWLDIIIPQWAKEDGWALRGLIGLGQSTNHRVRVISILQREEQLTFPSYEKRKPQSGHCLHQSLSLW